MQAKALYTLLLIFVVGLPINAQNDPVADKIVDDAAAIFRSNTSLCIPFKVNYEDLQNKEQNTFKGTLFLKGNKYKLETNEQTLYYNGIRLYQYLPEVKEVNMTIPEKGEGEEFELLQPQTYQYMSSKHFKANKVQETTILGRKAHEIDLYPIQLKTTPYSRIRIYIATDNKELIRLKAYFKNGTQYEIEFSRYQRLNPALTDNFFVFDFKANPDVELIDLTF